MPGAATDDDLDLLLSLKDDRVLETPPGSPRSPPQLNSQFKRAGSSFSSFGDGYGSDGSPRRVPRRSADMSMFRDSVKDYLEDPGFADAGTIDKTKVSKNKKTSNEVDDETFSGLRIRDPLVSSVELANRFSDIRFVRLPAIRNVLVGDTISGCWATVGVLTEKGAPRLSSSGKNYCIWKFGCLDELNVSVFLFGDAFTKNLNEPVGAVFALFNAAARKDIGGNGLSLSVYSAGQILKVGTSADYGVCKGKRKDGLSCTIVINKRKGAYCKFHKSDTSKTYNTTRPELKGGNIYRSFGFQPEGVYMVKPAEIRSHSRNTLQPVKVMSVDRLRRVLSNADKVTTKSNSQGIRSLAKVTAGCESKCPKKQSARVTQSEGSAQKRRNISVKALPENKNKAEHPETKKLKLSHTSGNMIELDIISSDEENR